MIYIKRKKNTQIKSTFLGTLKHIFLVFTHTFEIGLDLQILSSFSQNQATSQGNLLQAPLQQTLTKMGPTPRDSLPHMNLLHLLVDFLISF